MPENNNDDDNHNHTHTYLTYDSLNPLQQGFADALVEFESENQKDLDWEEADEDATEIDSVWDGITVHDFSPDSLRTIIEDCNTFVALVGDAPSWEVGHIAHEIGWHLYLQRQGAGVGLHDLDIEEVLLDRMVNAAKDLGSLSVEVGDDGQIHVYGHYTRPTPST
ncbi:hypothetical protein [Devosia sp. DBB001]|nr:hypothetical protein [Devosia sp. DBB001]